MALLIRKALVPVSVQFSRLALPASLPERRALQAAILIFGCVPVAAGLAGAVLGFEAFGLAGSLAGDSHGRYLSGLLLAIGLGFWQAVPTIERQGARIGLLTALVAVGGLVRLTGLLHTGWPDPGTAFALAMELVVTPSLWLWQRRLSAGV